MNNVFVKKFERAILGLLFLGFIGTVLFASDKTLESVLGAKDIEAVTLHYSKDSGHGWSAIQKESKDAVVQVFSFFKKLNLQKPCDFPDEYDGTGTGFFVNEHGYLVTNFHVINEAAVIYIQVPCLGKERFEVEVVGCSPSKDIAVLKLKEESFNNLKNILKKDFEREDITHLHFGDSDRLIGMQEVMVLGYPLGQENLKGCIGNVAGSQNIGGRTLMQTTAPLNPGNSGGPFFDTSGDVIGVQVSGISGAQNVGYFIPISEVKNIIFGIVGERYNTKLLRRPIWGSILQPTTDETLKFLGVSQDGGVRVSKVIKNSLFEKSGIEKGDIIYLVNGKKVDKFGYINVEWCEDKVPLYDMLDRFDIGEQIELVVYKKQEDGSMKETDIIVTVDVVSPLAISRKYPGFDKIDYEIVGGMIVMELTFNHLDILEEAIKQNVHKYDHFSPYSLLKYGLEENWYKPRLHITHIYSGSPIANVRCFEQRDVLSSVNGVPVETLDDFRDAIKLSEQTGYLTLQTEDGSFAAIPSEQILA